MVRHVSRTLTVVAGNDDVDAIEADVLNLPERINGAEVIFVRLLLTHLRDPLAAIALWLGFANLLDFTLAASLFGGGLAIAILGLRHVPLPAPFSAQSWLVRLHDEKSGIPYGVALAAGALVVLPGTEMYRLIAL